MEQTVDDLTVDVRDSGGGGTWFDTRDMGRTPCLTA